MSLEGDHNSSVVTPLELHRVSVKPPVFWKKRPALWFAQLESQFRTANITVDQTRFDIAVSSIDSEVLEHVSDIILNPPFALKYDTLKERLIEKYEGTEAQRHRQLLASNLELDFALFLQEFGRPGFPGRYFDGSISVWSIICYPDTGRRDFTCRSPVSSS
ncbi:hypothetical protein M8J77_014216 [Diaphorina citri]|nr:hypothetical protein M8J77_014216 [Diaphorina citri]